MKVAFFTEDISAGKVSDLLNIWQLNIIPGEESKALEWIQMQPGVHLAQYNFLLEDRGTYDIYPDDPYFFQQWQYVNTGANNGVPDADLDADLAWDISTGGLSPAGDTIVVAVIDGGVDKDLSDLAPNLWKNWGEIPDDGIDNDNNGYVDDFHGWNVWYNNDNLSGVTGHGTPVSAIVGARGNDGNGVAGVNWNVKIMFVAGGGTQANILAAYDYVLKARQRYNISNGQSGAFVVAVNCSWGTNYGQPANAPLWCAAFDSLGQAGILSVAATANIPVNVDEVGDLPTACPSDYLVSVTSLNNTDLKAPNAAWGATHVDLGAYGQGVFTAGANNSYGVYTGTSFAAPHVSGAIGLLYSAPCPNLIAVAKSDPAAAALWAKNLLLGSATPNTALQNITVTGGRLNLYSLLSDYEDQCSPCLPPFALHTVNITSGSALLKWSQIAGYQTVHLRWRVAGASAWNVVNGVSNSFLLENLSPCTEYEYSLMAVCNDGAMSDWSAPAGFRTDGCCEPPAAVWATQINASEAALVWNDVTAANAYRLRIRATGGGNWESYQTGDTSLTVFDLLPCTEYEAQVQTLCDTGATAFSTSVVFKTTGCGSCTDAPYCTAEAEDSGEEWIATVLLDNWLHDSGSGGYGYQDYTGNPFVPVLMPQVPVDVTIIPGFQSFPYKEFFRIFIDFNMDGDFNDDGELAFDPGWASDDAVTGLITPPDFSNPGLTRMRVMMKYKGSGGTPPEPCETFEFGQVEDYCVELSTVPLPADAVRDEGAALRIFPQPAGETVWLEIPGAGNEGWTMAVWNLAGEKISGETARMHNDLAPLQMSGWPTGMYIVRLERGHNAFIGRVLKQ